MIPSNASHPRLDPMPSPEAQRCRLCHVTCSWVGCQRLASYRASYDYVTRAGRLMLAERQLCEQHARAFARRFHLR